ncbi:MAG: ABC transporter permease [Ruminococcus sp.]|jgi:ribose transport system permease protein|nr:ABC transporter permease [Ruminococcus sp.]
MKTANISKSLKKYGIYLVLVVLIIAFSIATPQFLTVSNILNVARQAAMLGVASVGMIFVIIIGGIDLSVGSMVTFVNIFVAYLMVNAGVSPIVAALTGILVTTLIGLFNGWVVANIKIPALIATLATQIIFEGAAYIIAGGMPIFGFPKSFSVLGQSYIGFIPLLVIVMIICLIIGSFILNKTFFGRHFYAVGSNAEAAELSGIQVKRVNYLAYSLCGFFAGLSGVMLLSRTSSGQVTAGKGFEFDVISALVLGGVSVTGGSGNISCAVAGILIMQVLSNGFVLCGISTYWQMAIKGVILLAAVGFDMMQKQRQHVVKK